METIDLVETATQILELLSDQGISGKSLHAYTHTGIGCVIRHFQAKGILCAAPEMLDAFLLEQREFFDQGAFSVWKWRLLRRGCELLKHCAEKAQWICRRCPLGCLHCGDHDKASGRTHQLQSSLRIWITFTRWSGEPTVRCWNLALLTQQLAITGTKVWRSS